MDDLELIMNNDKPIQKKKPLLGWVIFVIMVVVFVGARQLHPGGIWGIIRDFAIESTSSREIKGLRDKMLKFFIPIGAAAICLKEYGENEELRSAIINYNNRNEARIQKLDFLIKAEGGMRNSEKDLLDRNAYQNARLLVGHGQSAESTCYQLARRINSKEFDLHLDK